MLIAARSARTAVAAAALVTFALGLTACGSDDNATSAALSTAATPADAGQESAAAAASESADAGNATAGADGSKDGGKDASAPSAATRAGSAGAAGGAAPSLANPLEDPNVSIPTHEPLQGGDPANDADREEMQRTVYNSVNPGGYEKWTRVLLENSCRRVTDPVKAELDRMGTSLEQVEHAARMQQQAGQGVELPHSEVTLDDVRVDGNKASASVTVSNSDGTETRTTLFEREDGRWKLCN